MASKYRDERLQGTGRVLGAGVSPNELGKTVGWHEMAARGDQDLEHLLRSRPAEIAWAEAALALLDRERSEEPDHRQGRPLLAGAQRTSVPFGFTTSQRPPNSRTF